MIRIKKWCTFHNLQKFRLYITLASAGLFGAMNGLSDKNFAKSLCPIRWLRPRPASRTTVQQPKIFSVTQAEIDGYRRRENEFRVMLDDLPTVKAPLTLGNERIDQVTKKSRNTPNHQTPVATDQSANRPDSYFKGIELRAMFTWERRIRPAV